MRGTMHPKICRKDPLLATKWGFCRRDKGVRFKKGPPFWGPAPPNRSWLQAWKNHFSFGNPGVGGHLDVMVYT